MRPNLLVVAVAFLLGCAIVLAVILAQRAVEVEVVTERHEASDVTIPTRYDGHPPPTVPPGTATTTTAPTPVAKRAVVAPAPVASGTAPYPSDELLHRLAMCETGGTMNPAIHNPTGKYRGAFQFSLETFASVGGVGDPHTYSYETQREFARALILRSGWGQFPYCSRAIGAR